MKHPLAASNVDEDRLGLLALFDAAGVHADHRGEAHRPARQALEGEAIAVGVGVNQDRRMQQRSCVGHGHAGSHSGTA
jgi:hypothetical protein